MRVRGFADLSFEESAGISFARAVERAATDPASADPEAWFVEERRISFNLERDLGVVEVDAHRRLLEELVREASSGEVRLDVEGQSRWLRMVPAVSGAPVVIWADDDDGDPERPTIRNRTA